MLKLISTATVAVFITAAVAQPIANANFIDDAQKKTQTAQSQYDEYQKIQQQQQAQQQQVQAAQQQFNINNTATTRQIVYDSTTGEIVTLVRSGIGVSAYNSAGQQIPMQADWFNTAGVASSNISPTATQQLSVIANTIKSDSNLNTIGKLTKALLALEAVKANNQIARQQYAKQLAQQKAQQAQSQPTTKTTTQQTAITTPQKAGKANTTKEEPVYASYLRDGADQTGGTASSVKITGSDLASQSAETPLQIDLIGKIVAIDGNILTIEDATGRKINVKVSDPESYSIGDNLNATGSILSGSDGNLYVVKDPETGMDVRIDKISASAYDYKVKQQQQAAEQFTQEYPQADGIAGTGAAGQYQAPAPAPEESSGEIETTIDEQPAPTDESYSGSGESDSSGGWFDGIKTRAQNLLDNWTWGKTASLAAVAGGTFMMGSAVAASAASGGTALPITAPLFQAGASLAGGGLGTLIVQSQYKEWQQEIQESHPSEKMEEMRKQNAEIEAKVEAGFRAAQQ